MTESEKIKTLPLYDFVKVSSSHKPTQHLQEILLAIGLPCAVPSPIESLTDKFKKFIFGSNYWKVSDSAITFFSKKENIDILHYVMTEQLKGHIPLNPFYVSGKAIQPMYYALSNHKIYVMCFLENRLDLGFFAMDMQSI